MKKVIFGGFCMLASLIGIFITFYIACLYPNSLIVNAIRKDFIGFLNLTGIITPFIMFCCLGAIGLLVGFWGLFEKD